MNLGRIICAFAAVVALCGQMPGARAAPLDKSALLALLAAGQYLELESRIGALQEDYQSGRDSDLTLDAALGAFRSSDPEILDRLNRWNATASKSWPAALARGVYFRHLAMISRGGRAAEDTAAAQLTQMRAYFERAMPDLERAFEIERRAAVAAAEIINVRRMVGRADHTQSYISKVARLTAESATVHLAILVGLEPQWGGTLDQIESHINGLRKRAADPRPGFDGLWGYGRFVQGRAHARNANFAAAENAFTQALAHRPVAAYLIERGYARHSAGNSVGAAADFEAAHALARQDSEGLAVRGWFESTQGNYGRALAFYSEALRFDTRNPEYLVGRSRVLRALGRHDDALADLDRALFYGNVIPRCMRTASRCSRPCPDGSAPGWTRRRRRPSSCRTRRHTGSASPRRCTPTARPLRRGAGHLPPPLPR